ncbi:hypothetical protein FHS43_004911 [Streptosporangium becharense]|uniref:Uncharacterized protein n=1 Tax=Streptosporangium becharense TaxID=1816182 RepID=A0A7W9IBK3_9ACTN|nr:hypothetical protein [Streptosporangium becharense]MBB2913602.1 hypothetical protein [Streptosporangium becharense]MBB5817683.1 hypothetical protein [Streptosporangium becharense]
MLQLISEIVAFTIVLLLIPPALFLISVVVLAVLGALALTTGREQHGSRTYRR